MCGIAGVLHLDGAPASAAAVERMKEAVLHRGPDGQGQFTEGRVGLGHRRLAVLDLTPAGDQPMATRDGRFVLTYNGEIYNFRELRVELQAQGHQFRSATDTEVVLVALAAWGLEALQRFNGMFALALWDRDRERLTLARDRYGIKPLYHATIGHTLLFGSEVKSILAHGAYRTSLDREALLEYLTFQNLFTDRTLFSGIHLLPAGHHLVVDGGEVTTTRWWDWDFAEPDDPGAEEEYVEELDRLFVQAVDRQLVSDVPVGSYLSGGMDSASITALASRSLADMRTFTIGFDTRSASGLELAFDEREASEHLSYLFGTEHYEMVLKAGDMERAMGNLVWHLEDLRVGQSYPNYYAAKLASSFGKVVLAGTGGDELFAGYPWRYYRAVINTDFEDYVHKYYRFWQRLVPNQTIHRLFRPIWQDVKEVWTRDIFRDAFTQHADRFTRPEDYINHSLYLEAKTFLSGLLLVEDKLSMAHGLETRVPFLDNDLVDFAMRVPVKYKLGNLEHVVRLNENEPGPKSARYFHRTRDGKRVLRHMLSRYIPEEITTGVKQGFSAPDASWFRGESIDYVRRSLLGRDTRLYDALDRDVVGELLGEHLDGTKNRRLLVWSLLCLEEWLAIFMDGRVPSATGPAR